MREGIQEKTDISMDEFNESATLNGQLVAVNKDKNGNDSKDYRDDVHEHLLAKEHPDGPSPDRQAGGQADVQIETEPRKPLMYRISECPPLYLLFLFAFQQSLLSISSPVGVTMVVSQVVCAQKDDAIKVNLLSSSFFMVGLATFAMTTFGVRLPIFQGPSSVYLVPLLAMLNLPAWRCPDTYQRFNPEDNSTVLMVAMGNGTDITSRELTLRRITELSGALVLAGAIHFLIGFTGLIGVLLRFIGPVTIVPAIVLVGLNIYPFVVTFCETNWLLAALTCAANLILSLYLRKRLTPMPWWSSGRGFHIIWFPLHQSLSVLFSIIICWIISGILTVSGVLTSNPKSVHYLARTDARIHLVQQTDWFILPYPGQFGPISFSAAGFSSFLVATIMSVLDSIGDYSACARAVRMPPPPRYAFNRGISVEGLLSLLSGLMGCCHATLSYGGNIGAIDVTGVASRRVFQLCGLIYVVFAIVGKAGALFISIPYPVLGGSTLVISGIFIGLVLSYLQFVDLNSGRNVAIIGTSLLLGSMMPYWVDKSPDSINTGSPGVDNVIRVLLANPSFVGGVFACLLDNTIPGSLKERGLVNQLKDLDDEEARLLAATYEDGLDEYRLPFVPDAFRRSKIAKYMPVIDYQGKS